MQSDTQDLKDKGLIRISKAISNAGYMSRRAAEECIMAKKVFVNKVLINTPAFFVSQHDTIEIEGKTLSKKINSDDGQVVKLFAFYKPTGYIVTEQDEQSRKTIYKILPKNLGRLIYVGRLDINSEGLLLLTNSGSFAREMSLPKNNLVRTYRVRAYGFFEDKKIERMSKGVIIDGVSYRPKKLVLERGESFKIGQSSNLWFHVELTEGKNREIRKIFEHFNLKVNRLIRTSYHNIKLENLRQGEMYEVAPRKVQKIVQQLMTS